ncbi:LysR family transcriptional regulator [Paenibacillus sp.]|uniref:LysR family transcriptional regulator n=1 Tax=Paenibacillus sp. TaxID=58172 RepID=UPI002D53BE02|nr:LysR family transcriptional regulator [Paenibacillus sp.]HZG56767.1 LysR family transcriptional regulator [Paenibacillus sp.]
MQLKRLQSFVHIVEKRSFTDAALSLGLTTSALSKQVKALEDELGASLFYRGASVEPTAAGKLVYERGRAMLRQWDELVAECRVRAASPSGKLRVGASTVPASYLLPSMLKDLIERYPGVEFSVVEDDSESTLARLEQRQVDVALVGDVRPSAALRFEAVAEDTIVVVAGRPHTASPNAERALPLPTETWIGMPFILREEGSGTRKALAHALERLGRSIGELRVAAVSSSTESALSFAEAGIGATAVSRWALSPSRSVSVVAELPTERRFYAAYEASRGADPLIRLFLEAASRLSE